MPSALFKHTCVFYVCVCSFSHHKIFSLNLHINRVEFIKFLRLLLFFCQCFVIHIDWSLAMRLRMRICIHFLRFFFCLNLKAKLAVHKHRFCLHFMWFFFGCPFDCSFCLFICWRLKDAEISFSFPIFLLYLLSNFILIFIPFEILCCVLFTFYYRFIIVELQNCCRCNSIQWCFVFISHTFHKKNFLYICFTYMIQKKKKQQSSMRLMITSCCCCAVEKENSTFKYYNK